MEAQFQWNAQHSSIPHSAIQQDLFLLALIVLSIVKKKLIDSYVMPGFFLIWKPNGVTSRKMLS